MNTGNADIIDNSAEDAPLLNKYGKTVDDLTTFFHYYLTAKKYKKASLFANSPSHIKPASAHPFRSSTIIPIALSLSSTDSRSEKYVSSDDLDLLQDHHPRIPAPSVASKLRRFVLNSRRSSSPGHQHRRVPRRWCSGVFSLSSTQYLPRSLCRSRWP